MKWDWLLGGGMWAPAERQPRPPTAPAVAPAQKVSANFLIRIAMAGVWMLWFLDKVPLWTVVIVWPLIEILKRIDVIAKTQFGVNVDEE